MKKQYTPEEIKELRSNYTTLNTPKLSTDLELKEKQYQTEWAAFNLLRPDVDEKIYLEDRIKDLKNVVKTLNKNVDKYVSEEIDGKELIEGNLIITKTGTGSDYYFFCNELKFLKDKFQQLTEPKEIENTKEKNEKTEQKEAFTFINNFDHVPEAKVIEYFTKELVETKYLDQEKLDLFLSLAFDKKEKVKERFIFQKSTTKKKITNIFYRYFDVIAAKPYGKQQKYVELLGEYFEGYNTQSLKSNFNK